MGDSNGDLALYLKMDEIRKKDNKVVDASGNSNHGTPKGNPQLVPDDTFGSCLSFDGDDYAEVGQDPFENNTAFTIEIWVKPTTINDNKYHGFIGKQGDQHRKPSMWLAPSQGGLHYDSYDSASQLRKDGILQNFFQSVGEWVHVAWVKEGTEYRFYRNGQLFATKDAPQGFYTTASPYWIGRVDNFWKGQIAHVRIYSRALSQEEIGWDMAEDQTAVAAFRKSHPIDFRLHDENDHAVLYIDDDNHPIDETLCFEISNVSKQDIQLSDLDSDQASPTHHHFELRFRAGTLAEAYVEQIAIEANAWRISRKRQANGEWLKHVRQDPTTGTVSLCFLYTQALTIGPGDSIILPLQNVRAAAGGGARGTRVELRYQNLTYAGETTPLQGHRVQHLSIVNHQGRKHIPLHVGFVGSNTILNDGRSENKLTLRITNVLKLDPAYPERSSISLRGVDKYGDAASKFILSFDASDTEEWALGTTSQVKNITVHLGELGTLSSFDKGGAKKVPKKRPTKRRPPSFEFPSLELKIELAEEIPKDARITIIAEDDTPKELTVSQEAHKGERRIYVKTLGDVVPQKDSKVYRLQNDHWQMDPLAVGESPEWILTPQTTRALKAGEHIQFTLSNIISSLPSGHANLYLHYENIPSYWDGQFVCPIRKAPIGYREDRVGIGTAKPKKLKERYVLHVNGDYYGRGHMWLHAFEGDGKSGTAYIQARDDSGTSTIDLQFRTLDRGTIREVMRLTSDGNVGIKGEVQAASFTGDGAVPKGVIVMWYGSPDEVPEGWALCDGKNGTPDLRDRFIVGAGQEYKLKNKGGSPQVKLTKAQMPQHDHDMQQAGRHRHERIHRGVGHEPPIRWGDGPGLSEDYIDAAGGHHKYWGEGAFLFTSTAEDHRHDIHPAGDGKAHENRPPYYALCFIMKL